MNSTRESLSKNHASQFLDAVLEVQPRIAAFDCDGTLWAGDAGEGFFSWEIEQRLISDEIARWARGRYTAYRAGQVGEDDMCGEMVYMHYGLTESLVQSAANQYFDQYILPQVFPEMQRLVSKLQEQGCDVWAVSSTNEWVIRAAMRHIGIPSERLLAASVVVKDGVITDELVQVPSGDGKPKAIRGALQGPLDAAFGNSKWDVAMLEMAAHAYAINPNPDLEALARKRAWRIYFPQE